MWYVGDDDVADGVTVVVTVGGAANVVRGDEPLLRLPKINIDARTRAAPNSTTTAAPNATCVLLKRLCRGGGGAGA